LQEIFMSPEQDSQDDVVSPALRELYNQNHLVPLWESKTAATFGQPQEVAHHWKWDTMQPIVLETGKIKAAHVLDRRVLLKTKAERHHPFDEAACGTLFCDFQLVLPGERARPHRHPMNALRFVVQSAGGVKSIVNGKDCVMEPGDMILTPGWCWHEHVNDGPEPVIWFDVLDVGLHYYLGTTDFQPGPARDIPQQLDDDVFAAAGIVPKLEGGEYHARPHSPIFRYPWAETQRALQAAPAHADGSRGVRFVNPLNGGPCIDLLDCHVVELERGKPTRKYMSSASTVCLVIEGQGTSQIGDKRIEWGPRDVFTMPARLWASHTATSGKARIFQVSNREVFRRLGLFSENHGD
jgi:gentisate 1,2-dioxygenase